MIKEGNNDFIKGQIVAYQNILQTKLTPEELQNLLNKQKELYQLEKHLENLKNEQVAQIQQANLPRNN